MHEFRHGRFSPIQLRHCWACTSIMRHAYCISPSHSTITLLATLTAATGAEQCHLGKDRSSCGTGLLQCSFGGVGHLPTASKGQCDAPGQGTGDGAARSTDR